MKHFVLITLIAVSGIAHAKVSDFNQLINDGIEAQQVVHKEYREKNVPAAQASEAKLGAVVIAAEAGEIVAPTQKDFLRHKKELTQFKPANKAQQERLAQELDSSIEF